MANVEENQDTDSSDEDELEEANIQWSNLIFLPFHPIFRLIVMFSVVTKSVLGPIQSVYPIVFCWDVMDLNPYLVTIKFFYWYCADAIYGIDTFLHIVHRQVTDEAMKREYLPKSALLLLLDFAALIPFFRLTVADDCSPTQLWPNVLAFSECLILYRVVEYFNLKSTHSVWNMLFGFLLLFFCTLNCMSCFWLLLTYNGFCSRCKDHIFDWRSTFLYKLNETSLPYTTYVYAMVFVSSLTLNQHYDDVRPFAVNEFIGFDILISISYLLVLCIILPKLFSESLLRLRRIYTVYPNVGRLIEETQRRNPSPKAYKSVEHFYSVMWKKRSGITHIPDVILELPRYLRTDIKLDLSWALFYHSPTLRKVSLPFKRYLCDFIKQDFKLPGEIFFAGLQGQTNLYYLKSGVVQIISSDEGITPILSVTSGTLFGDISFLVPPFKRKVTIKCLTYCEVMYLSRQDYLKALHKYPEDRCQVFQLANERMRHAKILYNCKQRIRGLDRAEDEGIAWLKQRWWELSDFLSDWKRKSKEDSKKFDLPPEETVYHCAKYIGQLVLCTEAQLLTKSLFANVNFPWLLVPHSVFVSIWRKFVLVTVFLVLITYPPNITREITSIPTWFKCFQVWTDLIYTADICVSLLTIMRNREGLPTNFSSVMFARCKTLYFNLDLLATSGVEYVTIFIGKPELFYVAQFNRLIKTYIIFTDNFSHNDLRNNPALNLLFKVFMINFCFLYISGYMIYTLSSHIPDVTMAYFFGRKHCEIAKSDPGCHNVTDVVLSWIMEEKFNSQRLPRKLIDIYIIIWICLGSYLINKYSRAVFISSIYLKYREVTNFQNFVTNLKKYFDNYKIHHDLQKRLDKYLICHWKYYQGADIMHPVLLKNEPYDIYWKVQGEVAEKTIGESQPFLRADPALIRDLAYAAKFLIVPKSCTLVLFGVPTKNVTWIVQGSVQCEYHNDDGELEKIFYHSGKMLSASSVFLGKIALRTYSACTDCEILYININDFYKIIQRYPNEWFNLDITISEFVPIFKEIFDSYVKKHTDYQKNLRNRIFYIKLATSARAKKTSTDTTKNRSILPIDHDFWTEPDSDFMQYWLLFRAITVFVSIINSSVQGGSGALFRRQLVIVGAFCDSIAWIDIILKLFLAYYNHNGILVYNKGKCMVHYLTRGFWLDIIGALPWNQVIRQLMSRHIDEDYLLLINTFCKFAHIYILIGYFNYMSDMPTIRVIYIKILKWQVVLMLVIFVASHYLMTFCVNFEFNNRTDLVRMNARNTCWLQSFFELNKNPDETQLHFLYAQSFNLCQCGLSGLNFDGFKVDFDNLGVGLALTILFLVNWYVFGYSLTLLVLNSQGNTVFKHGVSQLIKFLKAERVEQEVVKQAVAHFLYWWKRSKGINIHHLTNERIGVVFRQDLSYYFFKKTFDCLDTLLNCGEDMARELSSACSLMFILPGNEIVREMDLIATVYFVHRGIIVIRKNDETIATLAKGSVFGVLDGKVPRPVKITAIAEDYADVLQLGIKQFQELIDEDIRKNIAEIPTSKEDYLATTTNFVEDPYDTIPYILRGRKTILLPWMSAPMISHHGSRYSQWLYLAWLVEPFLSACIAIMMKTLKKAIFGRLYWAVAVLDLIFLVNFVIDFFSVNLVVINNQCVHRVVGYRKLKSINLYIDAISLIAPLLSIPTGNINYHLFRVLRLRLLFYFHKHFCKSFKSKVSPVLLKMVLFVFFLHTFSCCWIIIACRVNFPFKTPKMSAAVNATINFEEWVYPEDRPQGFPGCARTLGQNPETKKPVFVVPWHWHDDYILALTYVLLIYTNNAEKSITAITISQIYYQVIITFVIYIINIWLTSVTISFAYTRFRELYQYDYNVLNLLLYLKHSGLSPLLLDSVQKYTVQLWDRQRGNWLPELAQQAPMCLREDLLCALYMHHLETPPLFRNLPHYFKRQVAARLKRIVVFPGKCIVQEGDIFPCIYFIHEGDVEKWYSDKSGENRFLSILTTNGYFGQLPGLFPNFAFQFSYYSRTVVDMVYLLLSDWQDLLDGYPDIKDDVYTLARQIKKEFGKT